MLLMALGNWPNGSLEFGGRQTITLIEYASMDRSGKIQLLWEVLEGENEVVTDKCRLKIMEIAC